MPERTAQPLSPELILVSPAEEAARAREQLPDPPERGPEAEPVATDPSETTWNDFLADVRNRPAEPVTETRAVPRPPLRVRRNGRKRLLVAAVALLAVGAAVALGWAWDRGQQQPKSAASSPPVAPHSQAAAPKPKAHAKTTPAPAVTPASKPKKSPKPSSSHGAGAYVVRFLREGHKVLKIRTGSARLQLPSSFTFSPGRYRWTVTAIPSKGKGAHVIVNSAFTVG
jgi:hypothetical protein